MRPSLQGTSEKKSTIITYTGLIYSLSGVKRFTFGPFVIFTAQAYTMHNILHSTCIVIPVMGHGEWKGMTTLVLCPLLLLLYLSPVRLGRDTEIQAKARGSPPY